MICARSRGIDVEVEVCHRTDIAGFVPGSAHADEAVHQGGQLFIAIEGSGQNRERPKHDDGHLLGMGTHLLGEEFVGGKLVMELGTGKIHSPQPIGTVQAGGIAVVLDRQGGAKTRPARRIHLLDHRLHIAGRLFGGHIPRRRCDSQQIDIGIEQGQGNGEGAIDAGISYHNHFVCHETDSLSTSGERAGPVDLAHFVPDR